jgi:hypothetical protein
MQAADRLAEEDPPSLETQFEGAVKERNTELLAAELETIVLFLRVNSPLLVRMPPYAAAAIAAAMDPAHLSKLWTQLVSLHAARPARAEHYANLVFNAHRSWSHLLAPSAEEGEGEEETLLLLLLHRQRYMHAIAASFCSALASSAPLDEASREHWGMLSTSLSADSKRCIYKEFRRDAAFAEQAVSRIAPDTALDFLSAYMHTAAQGQSQGQSQTFARLMSVCLDSWGVEVVFNRVVRAPPSDCVASLVVHALSAHRHRKDLVAFARLASRLWGSAPVIRKGKGELHSYLTALLLRVIPALSKDELMDLPTSSGSFSSGGGGGAGPGAGIAAADSSACGGVSALSHLSMGVSACLDAADAGLRSRAMRVAKIFSKIMGVELDYDEDDLPSSKQREGDAKTKGGTKAKAAAPPPQHGGGGDSDSSGDSGLDAYVLDSEDEDGTRAGRGSAPDNGQPAAKFKTNYFRVCLEYFQLPEAAEDRRCKHIAALECVSRIALTRPQDARDMVGPLTKELLRISNSYNIEDFESLRVKALLCLYTMYPQFSVPVLSWAVRGEDLAVSTRLEAVAVLVKGAYSLSGVAEPGAGVGVGVGREKSSASSGIVDIKPKLQADSTDVLKNTTEKTIVKRPRKLAAMRKGPAYIKNHFGLLAEAVFLPVSSVVSALLAADARPPPPSAVAVDLADVLRHKRGAGTGISEVSTGAGPALKSKRLSELVDGIDLLLPSQCMMALASFTKCSVNAVCQR